MVERTYYEVTLGQDLNISIKAQGNPVPRSDQIQWLRFNKTLPTDSGHYVLDELNSTLHINYITRGELGLYQVVVTTITGTTSVRLTVKEFTYHDEDSEHLNLFFTVYNRSDNILSVKYREKMLFNLEYN